MSTKSSNLECYIKVLVSYDPSILIAANDDDRYINYVRLDEVVYSSLLTEEIQARGIQYNDDADTTAALLLIKSSEALTSSFFFDIPNLLFKRRKVVHYNYLLCFLIA